MDLSDERALFYQSLDITDAEERVRFLDAACAGDAALRGRMERMLRTAAEEDAAGDGFMLNRPELSPAEAEELPTLIMPAAGQSVNYFGDYVLLDEIARGGAGVVFRAQQSSLHRIVALKMLRDRPLLTTEADTKRFRAEAEVVASLDHPNIVPIYEVGTHEGQAYFSMKLITGGTLTARAAEFRESPRKAAALIAKVARAVHHAHGRGILHRDLKPGNILLDPGGEPHVTDFGLARRMGTDSGLTVSGSIMGTPHYMAPEQARGENREVGPATDVYSMGAVLYELLSGRRPFVTAEILALLQQVKDTPPPPLSRLEPGLDRDLGTIVMKCLEKSPAARYPSASALAEELERWLRGEPILARPASRLERLVKWARRRPVHATATALGVVALAAVGVAAVFISRGNRSGITPLPGPQLVAGGHRYQLMSGALPWEEAKEAAEDMGGHLAVISSEEEALHLLNSPLLAGVSPEDWCLLGAAQSGGAWKTVTGEALAAISGEPPAPSGSAWAVLSPSAAGIAATRADHEEWLRRCHGFIVEWDDGPADPPPAALPGAGPDGWVDLIASDAKTTVVRGGWGAASDGSGLQADLEKEKRPPLMQFDVPLPDEFDYEIEFAANSDTTVDVSMVFPTALPGPPLTARLTGLGTGFGHTFDGADELRSPVRTDDDPIVRNTSVKCRVEVRRTSLRLLLNDETVLAWTGAFHRLAGHADMALPDPRCPGLACVRTTAVFQRVAVRAAAGPSPAPAPFIRRVPLGEPGSPARILTSPDWSWAAPVSAGPGVNSTASESSVTLSADELILILGSERNGFQDLFECRRASKDEPFGPAALIEPLSGPQSHENGASLSPDGLTLVYCATAGPGHKGRSSDLYLSRRASREAPWGPPEHIDDIVNTPEFERDPWLSPDGTTLIFTCGRRNDELGGLWLSRRSGPGDPFAEPVPLEGVVDTATGEGNPSVSADGHTLLYYRKIGETKTLYTARLDGAMTTSQRRLDLPHETHFRSPWLAPDGRTLYVSAKYPGGLGGNDIWILKRQPGSAVRPGGP